MVSVASRLGLTSADPHDNGNELTGGQSSVIHPQMPNTSSPYNEADVTKSKNDVVSFMIAGATAGFVSSVASCPLDVVKTRLQAQRTAHGKHGYLGVIGMTKYILAHDGFRGMYRGLGPTIVGYLPTWAIYFSVYDSIKIKIGEESWWGHPRHVDAHSHQPLHRESTWTVHILSAMTAGATSAICTNPLWVIKTRFMTQPLNEPRYRHTLDAFITIYRTEGPRAFYRGLVPSLLGICHVAVQFPLYEQMKVWLAPTSHGPLPARTLLVCSAFSKMVASLVTYPHEVVRTRLQTQRRLLAPPSNAPSLSPDHPHHPSYRGIYQTAAKIVRQEGWRGLYKGLSINLFRTVPNSVVTLLTYELIVRRLTRPDH